MPTERNVEGADPWRYVCSPSINDIAWIATPGRVELVPSVMVDGGAKPFWGSLGDAQEVKVLTVLVWLLLPSRQYELMKLTLGLRQSHHDASVNLFWEKIARARLLKEPSVVDEPMLCAPGGAPEGLANKPVRPMLSIQPRYIVTASLPSPKNRNKAKPIKKWIQRSNCSFPYVGTKMILSHQPGAWIKAKSYGNKSVKMALENRYNWIGRTTVMSVMDMRNRRLKRDFVRFEFDELSIAAKFRSYLRARMRTRTHRMSVWSVAQ